jgi:hypothetical protein
MALNGISELATKELRQKAKLDLAATNRAAVGNPRATYDITQLPTQYDDNAVVDNPNDMLTLTPGVIRTGVKKVTYTGYHDDDVAFTDTATVTASTTANNFNIASIAENTTVLYTGYLLGTYTGNWTFTLTSDDGAYFWIGVNPVSGYTTGNANAASTYNTTGTMTVALAAGQYYPIRLLYGNGPAGGSLNLTYSHTGQSATNDFTGKLFSPDVNLLQGRPWTYAPFTFYEAFGTTAAISTTQYVSGNKIYAEASTYDVPSYQPARVVVNDIEVLVAGDDPGRRGHNLVVLDPNGDVVVPATQYDTYDPTTGADQLTALASALDTVPGGYIVVLVVYDASALDAGVRSSINTGYGSTNTDTWTAQRKSHIFIGEKI